MTAILTIDFRYSTRFITEKTCPQDRPGERCSIFGERRSKVISQPPLSEPKRRAMKAAARRSAASAAAYSRSRAQVRRKSPWPARRRLVITQVSAPSAASQPRAAMARTSSIVSADFGRSLERRIWPRSRAWRRRRSDAPCFFSPSCSSAMHQACHDGEALLQEIDRDRLDEEERGGEDPDAAEEKQGKAGSRRC